MNSQKAALIWGLLVLFSVSSIQAGSLTIQQQQQYVETGRKRTCTAEQIEQPQENPQKDSQ